MDDTAFAPEIEGAPRDPLIEAIESYNRARARYNAGDEASEKAMIRKRQFREIEKRYELLIGETPACTSEEGVLAALRLAGEDHIDFEGSGLPEALFRSILTFYADQINAEWGGLKS